MRRNLFICFWVLQFALNTLSAHSSPETFKKYKNKYFVETGSYRGDTIQHAIDIGYEQIRSVEILPEFYELCQQRFVDNENVLLYLGDSSTCLWDMIHDIDAPITFWLDGHYSFGVRVADKSSPILAELEAIGRHHIKNHTILIDDVRDFGSFYFDYVTKEEIINKILEINPNYTILYADCGSIENGNLLKKDVLIATIL